MVSTPATHTRRAAASGVQALTQVTAVEKGTGERETEATGNGAPAASGGGAPAVSGGGATAVSGAGLPLRPGAAPLPPPCPVARLCRPPARCRPFDLSFSVCVSHALAPSRARLLLCHAHEPGTATHVRDSSHQSEM